MTAKQDPQRRGGDAGFTLIESLVALVVFSTAVLMFQQTVASSWRGINAANAKTAAVTLALRILEETGAEAASGSGDEAEGQSGRYTWRRRVSLVDSGAAPTSPAASAADDVVTFWVEVDVLWRDAAARSIQSVRYHLLKSARRPT